MRGVGFELRRVFSEQKSDPVVERCDIGNAGEKIPSDFEYARYFMKYPEQLFCMFKNLIDNNDIEGFVLERKRIILNIESVGSYSLLTQYLNIGWKAFHCVKYRCGEMLFRKIQIAPAARADI